MKITSKWRKKAELYKLFVTNDWRVSCSGYKFDFSEQSAIEAFLFESTGKGISQDGIFSGQKIINGYLFGKKWMDWHITEWRLGIKEGILFKEELIKDNKYPNEWLNTILK